MSLSLYSPFSQYEDVECWYLFKFQNFLVQYTRCNRTRGTRLRNWPLKRCSKWSPRISRQVLNLSLVTVLPWIQLYSEWFLMLLIAKFTDKLVSFWMLVFQHFQLIVVCNIFVRDRSYVRMSTFCCFQMYNQLQNHIYSVTSCMSRYWFLYCWFIIIAIRQRIGIYSSNPLIKFFCFLKHLGNYHTCFFLFLMSLIIDLLTLYIFAIFATLPHFFPNFWSIFPFHVTLNTSRFLFDVIRDKRY